MWENCFKNNNTVVLLYLFIFVRYNYGNNKKA